MSFHSFRCAPLVKGHKMSITRGRSIGLPYQRMKEPIIIYLSLSLSTSFVPTRSAYLDYNLFNLHIAMCDNDNVVTDKVK